MKVSKKLYLILITTLLLAVPSWALCIKTNKANLRRGPGTRYEVGWLVYKYMPLREISRKGPWIKVRDFENDTHWVYKTLITKKFKCAVVKAKIANLRTGPGTRFRQSASFPVAEKYMAFKYVTMKGQWVKIKDQYDDTFWIYRKLVWIN